MDLSTEEKNLLLFSLNESILVVKADIRVYKDMDPEPAELIKALEDQVSRMRQLSVKIRGSKTLYCG